MNKKLYFAAPMNINEDENHYIRYIDLNGSIRWKSNKKCWVIDVNWYHCNVNSLYEEPIENIIGTEDVWKFVQKEIFYNEKLRNNDNLLTYIMRKMNMNDDIFHEKLKKDSILYSKDSHQYYRCIDLVPKIYRLSKKWNDDEKKQEQHETSKQPNIWVKEITFDANMNVKDIGKKKHLYSGIFTKCYENKNIVAKYLFQNSENVCL